jgi:UDP-N-acetylglucosamine 2-epimerase (non-hydrolysing)
MALIKSRLKRNKTMKIAIIMGTRPEIIKMSPIIRKCGKPDNKVHII